MCGQDSIHLCTAYAVLSMRNSCVRSWKSTLQVQYIQGEYLAMVSSAPLIHCL